MEQIGRMIFGEVGLLLATRQDGGNMFRPAMAPARVWAHNSGPAPPSQLIRGPANEHRD